MDDTPSDAANPDFPGNAMAVIPLVWLKCWEDGQYEYYNFADYRVDETYRGGGNTSDDRCGVTCIGFSAPVSDPLWCYGVGLSCEQPKTV